MENFGALIASFKSKIEISEIISNYIQLTDEKYGRCPFHDDHHPSLSINKEKQYFYCFSCGAGGDVISFIQKIEGFTFAEAIKKLSEITGIDPGFILLSQSNSESEDLNIISNIRWDTISYYHSQLEEKSIKYLNDRGINEESNTEFLLGYANGQLREYLISKNYPVELCIKAGVLKRNKDGEIKDVFFNSIIIPNIVNGSVAFISSRSLDNSTPKYLNQSGQLTKLFNEDKLKNKNVLLTEGIIDAIAANQFGFAAVSLYGVNSFTPGQLNTKFSNQETVNICLDTDEAGKEAAIKIAQELGEKARIINLPGVKDLNEYFLMYSKEEFQSLNDSAQDLFTFLINEIPSNTLHDILFKNLKSAFEKFAVMEAPEIENNLMKIKTKFNLNKSEVEAYRSYLKNKYKKQNHKKESDSNSNFEIRGVLPGLVDFVIDNDKVYYLMIVDDRPIVTDSYHYKGKICVPPKRELLPFPIARKGNTLKYYDELCSGSNLEFEGKLFGDIVDYLKKISDLPDPLYYNLIAAWIILSYFYEKVDHSTILYLYGLPERGKSTTGKGIINISYRGLRVESLREAYIFRYADYLQGSLFFDVIDFNGKIKAAGSEDLIAQRFEKGSKIPRVLYPDREPFNDMKFFEPSGATLVASNYPNDEIIATRCIEIVMPDSEREFDFTPSEDLILEFKEKLTALRAKYLDIPFPSLQQKPAKKRLGDLLKPFNQIILQMVPDKIEEFNASVKILEKKRTDNKSFTLEADIILAIYNLFDIYEMVDSGKLSVDLITQEFNKTRDRAFHKSNWSIGRKLTALGFERTTMNNSCRAIEYNELFIKNLMKKYGLDDFINR